MVVVSHLFLFLWKNFRGRFDSCKSNLPLKLFIIKEKKMANDNHLSPRSTLK